MDRSPTFFAAMIVGVGALVTSALADGSLLTFRQPPPPDVTEPETEPCIPSRPANRWTVQIEPSVWWASPAGKLRLPASSGSGPAGFTDSGDKVKIGDLNLDTPRFSPAGELQVNVDEWRFTFSGASYELTRSGTIADTAFRLGSVEVAPGDALDVDFRYSTFELSAGYEFFYRDFERESKAPEDAVPVELRVYGIFGARLHDTSSSVTQRSGGTGSAGYDGVFGEPLAGVRVEAEIVRDFTIDVQLSFGAMAFDEKSSFSIDISTGFHWRPTPNVGLQIGWRQVAFSLADGEDDSPDQFEYEGTIAGLFTGLVIRF